MQPRTACAGPSIDGEVVARNCRRRARFSRTRSSRERKTLTNQPRKCRSDTIIAGIISEKSESSFAPSHSFCRCTTFWRGTAFGYRSGPANPTKQRLRLNSRLPHKHEVAGSSPALPTIFPIKTRVSENARTVLRLRCTAGVTSGC